MAKGETCVALAKPLVPASASRRKNDDEDTTPARRKPERLQANREQPRQSKPAREFPRDRPEAVTPSGGRSGKAMIGVGF